MSKTWSIATAKVNFKKGDYVVVYDPNDPRNTDEKEDGVRIICVIAPSDKMDDNDLKNAAIIKKAKNMLTTLLKVRDRLSKGKRGGFAQILATDTINLINSTLKDIHKR